MNTIKKYWGIIAAFLMGIITFLLFKGNSKQKAAVKETKAAIKTNETQTNAVETKIDDVKKAEVQTKDNIVKSEDKSKDLENKIDNTKSDSKDVKAASDFLKDFANKNGKKPIKKTP